MDSVLFCKTIKFACTSDIAAKWFHIFFQTLTAIRTCRPARKPTFSGTNSNLLNFSFYQIYNPPTFWNLNAPTAHF